MNTMNFPARLLGSVIPVAQCSSCSVIHFQPLAFPSIANRRWSFNLPASQFSRYGKVVCKMSATETEPESGNNEKKDIADHLKAIESVTGKLPNKDEEEKSITSAALDSKSLESQNSAENGTGTEGIADHLKAIESVMGKRSSKEDEEQPVSPAVLDSKSLESQSSTETSTKTEGTTEFEVASGSPLPGVKPQRLDESIKISKETIDILKDHVFGFDSFFITSQEPYEGGVLFKGNLRGEASTTYEKIRVRMQDRFGDLYKLFLLINPEDDTPVAVVVPKMTLQPDSAAVPEWFAAGSFGLVTIFTLLLRNVPALQSNFFSIFENPELLKDGLPGALVIVLILGAHEISHILVARESGIKLGVPFFVPSSQIGSFGAITRILNIVKNREDLLKFAAAGPLAGFSLGFVLLLLGFILPPTDGLGTVVDTGVFHESLLVGGIAKLLLGDALKEGASISVNPLVIWAWAGLLINAINSIPAGELDGGRISFALFGRKGSARLTGISILLLGLSSLVNDVAFYWVALIFFLQRGPVAPVSEEISSPDNKYVSLGVVILFLGLLVCLPYPLPFNTEAMSNFL